MMRSSIIILFAVLQYGLLVPAAIAGPAPGSIASMRLLVSATSAGQQKTRIVETLPPGARTFWTSIPASAKDGTLTFDLTAGREEKQILYLFQPSEAGGTKTSSEVFIECGGKFVSQGKAE
jgi:hypothetical protein